MRLHPELEDLVGRAERCDDLGLYEHATAAGMGDGLPLLRPTPERVHATLGARDADEEVGAVPPLLHQASVGDVAVCTVMAGGGTALLPLVLAAVRAALHPSFNLLGVATTTGNAAVTVVLHGPCIEAVGANAAGNCFGPGTRANAVVGRAVSMSLRWLGGASVGTTDMSIVGQPAMYGACLAEASPPESWPPLHVEQGLAAATSAVTVFAASTLAEVVDSRSGEPEGLLETLACSLAQPAAVRSDGLVLTGGQHLVVLPHEWASTLAGRGWSKQDARAFLAARSEVPLDRLAASHRAQVADEVVRRGRIGCVERPEDLLVLVAGGPGTKATHLGSWPGDARSVTVPLDWQPPEGSPDPGGQGR